MTLTGQPTDEDALVEKGRVVWPEVPPRIKDNAMLDKVFSILDIKM